MIFNDQPSATPLPNRSINPQLSWYSQAHHPPPSISAYQIQRYAQQNTRVYTPTLAPAAINDDDEEATGDRWWRRLPATIIRRVVAPAATDDG